MDINAAQQAATEEITPTDTSGMGSIDIAEVGRKVKQIYPGGVASDGRPYASIPDEEIGSKFILKNGDKGLVSLGMTKAGGDTKASAQLRKEFNGLQEIKDYKNALDSWNRVKDVPNNGSGDLTLMYSYIKALDPTSAVREGEINISKATASIPENIVTAYKRAKEGKLLSDEQRQEYQGEVGRIYNSRAEKAKQSGAFYSGLATDMGGDPKDVVGGLGDIQQAEIPQVKQEEKGMTGLPGMVAGGVKAVGDFVAPDVMNLPETVGGIVGREQQKDATRPDTKGDLMGSAKYALERTLGFAGDTIPKAIMPAIEAASAIEGVSAMKNFVGGLGREGIKQGVKTAGKAVLDPLGTARGALKSREVAAASKAATEEIGKVVPKRFVQVAKQVILDDPEAGTILKKQMPSLKNIKNVADVERKLDTWKRAYTASGKVGNTSRADLFSALYREGVKVLEDQAPEAAKYRSFTRMSYQIPKTIGKGLTTAAKLGLAKMGIGF